LTPHSSGPMLRPDQLIVEAVLAGSLDVMLLAGRNDAGLLGSYGRAFQRLGYRTDPWDFEAAETRHARLGGIGARFQRLVIVEPWLKRANRELVIAVRERKPDILGVGCATRVTAGALAQIRASSPSTRLVLFWPDPLQNLEVGTVQALPLYDLVATYARSSVDPLLRLGAKRVEWVPFAADTELFESYAEVRDQDAAAFACDVGFIANFRPERERAVLALRNAGIHVRVWGVNGWQKRSGDKRAARGYWEGRPLFGPEFARATRSFKLALNVIDPTNYPGANMRFFETLACGGTLLTSACPELCADFPDGVAAHYFESIDHLVRRARELLPQAAARRAIAEEGRRRVLAGHTYVDRAQQVLRALTPGAETH